MYKACPFFYSYSYLSFNSARIYGPVGQDPECGGGQRYPGRGRGHRGRAQQKVSKISIGIPNPDS